MKISITSIRIRSELMCSGFSTAPEIAGGITQESFLKFLSTELRHDENRKAYLYRIATNQTYDYFRRHSRESNKHIPADSENYNEPVYELFAADSGFSHVFDKLQMQGCALPWLAYRVAVKDNSLSDDLKKHLENCGDCRETQKIARFFQSIPAKERIPAKLPTAGFVWWKSQLQKKRAAAERASKPILLVEIIVAVVFCLISFWLLNSSLESSVERIFASLEQLILPIIGAVIVFGLIILFHDVAFPPLFIVKLKFTQENI